MIEIELEKKVSYAFNGEEHFASKVLLVEPKAIWAKEFAAIKKEITKATEVQVNKDKNKKIEDDGKEIPADELGKIMMMLVSMNADPVIIYSKFEELIKAGLILVAETNIKFTQAMFDKLALNDFNKIIEVYIGNFMKS